MRSALVVAPNWIGDALLAQPLFMRLQALHPGLELDAIAPDWVAPVLARMPQIRRVFGNRLEHGKLRLRERRALAGELRANRYDAAFVLPNSFKSALVPFLAGIPLRIGFRGESRYVVLNRRHRLDESMLPLMADRYLLLAEPPGTAVPARPSDAIAGRGGPRLQSNPQNRSRAIAELGLNGTRPMVALCAGAEYGPAKRWPPRYFATIALHFAARGREVWLFGSQKDREIATEIASLAPGACVNLAGKTSLLDAIDLLAGAEVVVSNDSGLMHVAAALGRRVVALYGSSSPRHTPPLSASASIARIPIDCSPCYARECPLGHFRCMNDLTPAIVLAHLTASTDGEGNNARK